MIHSWHSRDRDRVEIMDAPDCDPVRLANTYRHFGTINAAISGWRGLYRSHLRPALADAGAEATLLDIGCGGGDVLRQIAGWAARDGLRVRCTGIDPDVRAIDYAESIAGPPNLRYCNTTATELADAGERYDVVLSNHVLHHLSDHAVTWLCRDSMRLARRLALHADIHRHPIAYTTFPLVAAWFRDSFILEDGLLSIRRAFTPDELRRVAPADWQVGMAFPFRVLLSWKV